MGAGFTWDSIGDVRMGRPTLGDVTSVTAYRLALFSLRSAIADRLGEEEAKAVFYAAGKAAGQELFRRRFADLKTVNAFVQGIATLFNELKVGIFRIEDADAAAGRFEFSVLEDLDCSGTDDVGAPQCPFDEGVIAGLLGAYLGKDVTVRESECWGAGGKMCRFQAVVDA